MRRNLSCKSISLIDIIKKYSTSLRWIVAITDTHKYNKGDITYYLYSSGFNSIYFYPENNYNIYNYPQNEFRHLTDIEIEEHIYQPFCQGIDIPPQALPPNIVRRIVLYQLKQGREVKYNLGWATSYSSTFNYSSTPEGFDFWYYVLNDGDYDRYYKRYPSERPRTSTSDTDLSVSIASLDKLSDTLTKKEPIPVKAKPKISFTDTMTPSLRLSLKYLQKTSGNPENLNVFDEFRQACKSSGGFNWDETFEGDIFWEKVLIDGNFDVFSAKYSSFKEFRDTRDKYLGLDKTKKFSEVVPVRVRMAIEFLQEKAGNKPDITVFDKYSSVSRNSGGFLWSDTADGKSFWERIMIDRDFKLFLNRYDSLSDFIKVHNTHFSKTSEVKEKLEGVPPKPLTDFDLLGLDIRESILFLQQVQTGRKSEEVFRKSLTSDKNQGGFSWDYTIEGFKFWEDILRHNKHTEFFKKYKSEYQLKRAYEEKYGTTDITVMHTRYKSGDIWDEGSWDTPKEKVTISAVPEKELSMFDLLPQDIKDSLLFLQQYSGNPINSEVYQRNLSASKTGGGFDWSKTLEGGVFWADVLSGRDYDLFFSRYTTYSDLVRAYTGQSKVSSTDSEVTSLIRKKEKEEVRKMSPMVNIHRPKRDKKDKLPVARGNIKRK